MGTIIIRRLRDLEARLDCAFARLTLGASDPESLQLARISILHGLQDIRLVLSELDSPHRRTGELAGQYALPPLGANCSVTDGTATPQGPTRDGDYRA
jgi:hypothetical protein